MKAMNKNLKVKDFSVMKRELRELVKQKEKKETDKRKFDEKERINLQFIEFVYLHTRARHNCTSLLPFFIHTINCPNNHN